LTNTVANTVSFTGVLMVDTPQSINLICWK